MGRAHGFTLLEMLVVLTILALMVVVAPRFSGGSPGLQVRGAAASLAADLRLLQRAAVSQHAVTSLALGPHGYTFVPGGAEHSFGAEVAVKLIEVAPDILARGTSILRFFPDGSSSGGTIELDDRAARARVYVRLLDGGISTDAS